MTRAKNVLHGMKVELQDVDKREAPTYQKKIEEYKQKFDATNRRLLQAANAANKEELRAGSPRGGAQQDPQAGNKELLDQAGQIQAQDKKATKRMLRQIEQTKELGADTM